MCGYIVSVDLSEIIASRRLLRARLLVSGYSANKLLPLMSDENEYPTFGERERKNGELKK